MIHENRKWPRVYFSVNDAVAGEILIHKEQVFSARVLNVSEGGLALSLKAVPGTSFKKGDRFQLKALEGKEMLVLTAPAVMEVKWVTALEGLEMLGLGCAFLYMVPPDRVRLRRFMEDMDRDIIKPEPTRG
ncbi:PilZ domain-containing protein [Desulfobotulus sp. H1]|uniref:PilZ domain-containing protein n=1 Tax=Desulfobotulus pelophilus TaxID=2823377 RepID=A0ABT3N6Y2_9BACT|nr:PilZ domain-containing protein [Desulfobotulus pelophilus]MCW7753206.1 PilZ domain-containing protein [Desulfobotulus pelophilus]